MGQLTLAVEHLGTAIEDQFVLAAHLIEVDQRQTGLAATLRHQFTTDPGFLLIVGRGVDGEQQLGPCRLGGQRRARLPQVFADKQPQLMATEGHHAAIRARSEIALLVKYAVVGQVLLEVAGDQLALLIEGSGVIERRPFTPGMPHQNGAAALPGRDASQRSIDTDHQVAAQQQVFRRIAGQGELGAHQQVGALLLGLSGRSQHLVTVIFDGAYRQIQLGKHQREGFCHGDTS